MEKSVRGQGMKCIFGFLIRASTEAARFCFFLVSKGWFVSLLVGKMVGRTQAQICNQLAQRNTRVICSPRLESMPEAKA
eukprot:5607120-Amphidinium_carterae.2